MCSPCLITKTIYAHSWGTTWPKQIQYGLRTAYWKLDSLFVWNYHISWLELNQCHTCHTRMVGNKPVPHLSHEDGRSYTYATPMMVGDTPMPHLSHHDGWCYTYATPMMVGDTPMPHLSHKDVWSHTYATPMMVGDTPVSHLSHKDGWSYTYATPMMVGDTPVPHLWW